MYYLLFMLNTNMLNFIVLNIGFLSGWTSLHAAAANGHVRVCRLLCEGGADLTIKTYDDEMVDSNYEGHAPLTQISDRVPARP